MKWFLILMLLCLVLATVGCKKKDPRLLTGPELWEAACERLSSSSEITGVRPQESPGYRDKVLCFTALRDGVPEQKANKIAACFLTMHSWEFMDFCLPLCNLAGFTFREVSHE